MCMVYQSTHKDSEISGDFPGFPHKDCVPENFVDMKSKGLLPILNGTLKLCKENFRTNACNS